MFASRLYSLILAVLLVLFGSRANAAVHSIYLGGTGDDSIAAVAEDSGGNIYVTGFTYSTDFQGTAGGAQATYGGGPMDCFVVKLSSDLTLLQATYLGGSGADRCTAIALDSFGNVYVTGLTNSTDFPNTAGGVQPNFAACTGVCYDVFVAKLNSSLTTLTQATYLGGNKLDYGFAMVIDSADNIYVAGVTMSTNFPNTAGGAQSSLSGAQDAYVAKLNSALTHISQATYFGGSSTGDMINTSAIALDGSGNVYITGYAYATTLPGITGGAQTVNTGASNYMAEGFVAKFNPALTSVLQSTFYGGSGDDMATGIDLDSSGNVYVTGYTNSTDLPNVASGAQTAKAGGSDTNDAFVVKFNPTLTAISQATYLGGSGNDRGNGLVIKPSTGDVFVAGSTNSTDFPKTTGGIQETNAGGYDGFISKLTSDLKTITQSTYYGGSNDDGFNAILWTNNISAAQVASDNAPEEDVSDGSLVGAGGGKNEPNSSSEGALVYYPIPVTLMPPLTAFAPDIAVYVEGKSLPLYHYELVDFGESVQGNRSYKSFTVLNKPTATMDLILDVLTVLPFPCSPKYRKSESEPSFGATKDSSCQSGLRIQPGDQCYLGVRFYVPDEKVAPVTVYCEGQVLIASNDPDAPDFTIRLSGKAVKPPIISVAPVKLNLGKPSIGTTSPPRKVGILNKGQSRLELGLEITGENAAEFSQVNDCGSELSPGSTCSAAVTFTPNSTGKKTAILAINSNDPKKPSLSVKLSGTGAPRRCKLINCQSNCAEYIGNQRYCCKEINGIPTGICKTAGTSCGCADYP